MKYIFILFCSLVVSFQVYAQEQLSMRQRADKFYLGYNYAFAADLYLKLIDNKEQNKQDIHRLADCYDKMNDYGKAIQYYSKLVKEYDEEPESLLRYGVLLMNDAQYEKASEVFKEYGEKNGYSQLLGNYLKGCAEADSIIESPKPYTIRNMRSVNTPYAEFGVYKLGEKYYYAGEVNDGGKDTRNLYGWTGNGFLKLYEVTSSGSTQRLSNGKVASDNFNEAKFHVGPIAANKSGDVAFVTQTNTSKVGENRVSGDYRFNNKTLKLFIYTKQANGKWDGKPFAYNDVKKYSLGHAVLSPDEKTLYYVSDMPGSIGGTDIWFSELQDDESWSAPINAGEAINTEGDELFPFLDEDGTLYFSSNGHAGLGGLDIFQATGSKDNWKNIANLGYPINSSRDDFSFYLTDKGEESKSGYLASNRSGGVGNDDIYSFVYSAPEIRLFIAGTVRNKLTGDPLNRAMVGLHGRDGALYAKEYNKNDGTFLYSLEKDKDYKLKGQKIRYGVDSTSFTTIGMTFSDTLYADLYLEPEYEVGKKFVLENILYDLDKSNIRADAVPIMDRLVQIMRDNPTLKIELASHTDSRATHAYNIALSERRAKSAVNYLIERGIARSRMVAKGYGETVLVNRCADGVACTEEEHQKNRRTEITVLEY